LKRVDELPSDIHGLLYVPFEKSVSKAFDKTVESEGRRKDEEPWIVLWHRGLIPCFNYPLPLNT